MRVKIGDGIYQIEFEYFMGSLPDTPEKYRNIMREVTTCRIWQLSNSVPAILVAVGTVRHHYKDSPNRDKARKAAFRKVLDNLPTSLLMSLYPPHPYKEIRKLFWDAYLNRKKV